MIDTATSDLDRQSHAWVKAPGDFMRAGPDGPPLVADPSGELVASGPRKGQPRMIQYGRASAAADQILNDYNLQKWRERMIVRGMAVDLELGEAAERLATLDPDSAEFRTLADGVVAAAKRAAKAHQAAERGSWVHALVEVENGEGNWLGALLRGAEFDIPPAVAAEIIDSWNHLLERWGFEVLAVEQTVINDELRLAGRLDYVVRATRPILTTFGLIDRGDIIVLDVKTGRLHERAGRIAYWNKYAAQIFAYASGVPYDVDTDTRGEWAW